jgi:hypothetical protein
MNRTAVQAATREACLKRGTPEDCRGAQKLSIQRDCEQNRSECHAPDDVYTAN